MLKYSSLIMKLSDSQKVRLLTDISSLSGKDFKLLGIPQVKIGNIKDFCEESFPKASAASSAWDRELWSLTAEAKLTEMAGEKINFVVTPGPKVKLSPYRRDLTEDPFLASEIATAYSSAMKGCVSAPAGYYLASDEMSWLDKTANPRVINDFLVSPFRHTLEASGAAAVLGDIRPVAKKAYSDLPMELLGTAKEFPSRFVICERATEENTVELITRGVICLDASANALEGAMTKYKNTMASIERNGLSLEESLREDERSFLAVSPEKVDAAVDNLLDFAFACNERRPSPSAVPLEDTAMRAVLESTVLLKNENGVLPLASDSRVLLLGSGGYVNEDGEDVVSLCRSRLEESGIECTASSWMPGDIEGTRSFDELLNRADTVVVFLGFKNGEGRQISKNESLYLPAKQIHLMNTVVSARKRIIAVISSAYTVDVEFSGQTDAMLFAPLDTKHSAEALARIITGEYNPSGRLASTLYSGSRVAFDKRRAYAAGGMKSGPFVGYRYYDTAGMSVGYPFGHGLSYTRFSYSGLSVKGRVVSFTVKNVGERAGEEVAEVYIGKRDSAVIRPYKELCGFERVALAPGESRRIELEVRYPEIYRDGKYLTENGEYTVFVGASVSDIRQSVTVDVRGDRIDPDGERLCDYLQSVSNVLEDNYTLEAKYSTMKRTVKNIVAGSVAILLAACLAVFNAFSGISSLFIGIIAGILALCAVYFFVSDNIEKSKEYAKQQEEAALAYEAKFSDAESIDALTAERMFGELFDTDGDDSESEASTAEKASDDAHLEYIDSRFTLRESIEEFERFASEKGYKFSEDSIACFFTSLASSRLLVSVGIPADDFKAMALLLSEYFGGESYMASTASVTSAHGEDQRDDGMLVSLPFALGNALSSPEKINVLAFDGLDVAGMTEIVKPFTKYISCPKDYNEISLSTSISVASYTIPANVWLFVNLKAGSDISELPVSVARQMAYNDVRMIKCPASDSVSLLHGLNRYQLDYIGDRESKCDVPEDLWKKVDKLEKFVGTHAEYSIGNKLWLNFEKHLALLTAVGVALPAATDFAIAARLLPSMTVTVSGKLGDEDEGMAETLEFIFGEDNVKRCKDFITELESAKTESAKTESAEPESAETVPEKTESEPASVESASEIAEADEETES